MPLRLQSRTENSERFKAFFYHCIVHSVAQWLKSRYYSKSTVYLNEPRKYGYLLLILGC